SLATHFEISGSWICGTAVITPSVAISSKPRIVSTRHSLLAHRCTRARKRCGFQTRLATIMLLLSAAICFDRRFAPHMYFLYSVLMAIGMVLLAPYFALQGLRRGKYLANFRQRMGHLPPMLCGKNSGPSSIWVHAVSVGEVLAAKPLIDGLKQRFPARQLFLSTTTATGQRVARERIASADGIFYFPFDWSGT